MNYIKHLPAYLLAFLFLFAGINYFFPLVPMPAMTGNQKIFFDLFGPTGYMAVIKVIEIIAGILILLPSKRALAITLLAPISVNIFLYEILIIATPGIGIALIVLNAIVIFQEKEKFKVLF
jgi:hypothetical protein